MSNHQGSNIFISICDIPIYSISLEKYNHELHKYINDELYRGHDIDAESALTMHKEYPDIKHTIENHLTLRHGGPWKFNKIIGYLCLHIKNNKLNIEYWKTTKPRNKIFLPQIVNFDVTPLSLSDQASNKDIFHRIQDYINKHKAIKEFKNRYIDTDAFYLIGSHIDWLSILKNHDQQKHSMQKGEQYEKRNL